MSCFHLLVMGVAGSGKTTVANALALGLDLEMIEGDDYHCVANVEKMRTGVPLTDEDRWPWLRSLAGILGDRHERAIGTVLACSALRRSYRDVIRSGIPIDEVFTIHLDLGATRLRERLTTRRGHYMPASLLESQLEALERPRDDEPGVAIDASRGLDEVVADAVAAIRGWRVPTP